MARTLGKSNTASAAKLRHKRKSKKHANPFKDETIGGNAPKSFRKMTEWKALLEKEKADRAKDPNAPGIQYQAEPMVRHSSKPEYDPPPKVDKHGRIKEKRNRRKFNKKEEKDGDDATTTARRRATKTAFRQGHDLEEKRDREDDAKLWGTEAISFGEVVHEPPKSLNGKAVFKKHSKNEAERQNVIRQYRNLKLRIHKVQRELNDSSS